MHLTDFFRFWEKLYVMMQLQKTKGSARMDRYTKTLLYGTVEECQMATDLIGSIGSTSGRTRECRHVQTYDDLREQLIQWNPSLVIVLANGAAGMEGAFLTRERRPGAVVFWFSNDKDFGLQAYRLECDYFSTKPMTVGKLERALRTCSHFGL